MNTFEQTQLFGLEKYFFEITKLFELNKMPNKILLSGKKGSGKSTLGFHIVNYILSYNEDSKYDIKNLSIDKNNRSFKLICNNTHPNFYLIDLIDDRKTIEINQIREMLSYTNKSSFNQTPRIIFINNIEYLNKNSSNALLKIIEDPNINTYFILIHNSNNYILPTIKSRCLNFKINLSFDETIKITNFLLNENLCDLINDDLINYYNTPGDFINLINFAKEKKIDLTNISLISFLCLLIDGNYYKKNEFIKNLIFTYIELYFLKIYKLETTKNNYLNTYHYFINKINDVKKFNLDEESFFIELKSKLLND